MMKIKFPILDKAIEIKQATYLILEESLIFADVVKCLYQYCEESKIKIMDSKMKLLKETEFLIVTDILGYNVNSTSVLKLIHTDLENQLNEKIEVKSEIEKLFVKITELIAFECLENELDLEYDELTILKLIQALSVRLETYSNTIFDKILEIIQIFKYLSKKRLLIFINVSSYLSKDEITKVIEYINLYNIDVLFLEPRKIYHIGQYVLDEDYCLMYENML